MIIPPIARSKVMSIKLELLESFPDTFERTKVSCDGIPSEKTRRDSDSFRRDVRSVLSRRDPVGAM